MDRNLRLLTFGSAVRSFGLTLVGPFAALYLFRVGGIGYVAIGVLLAVISVPPLLWSPYAGTLADRVGRRPVFVVSLLGEGGAVAVMAISILRGSIPGFLIGLAADGMLASAGGPALSAYFADVVQGSERTVGFTWLRIGTNIGFATGVAVGGIVIGTLGFGTGALAATAIVLVGAAVVAVGLDASPYDRRLRDRRAAPSPGVVAAAPTGLRGVARDRLFLSTSLAFALAILTTAQWGTTYALFAGQALGLPYAAIGAGFALNGVIVVFGQTTTTQAMLGRRHTTIMMLGTAAYAAGFLLLGATGRWGMDIFPLFLLATAILTLGENLVTIPIATLPSNLSPPEAIATYNGVFGTILGFGGLLGTVEGGVALASLPDPALLWIVLVAPAVPALALLAWVGRRLPDRPNRA